MLKPLVRREIVRYFQGEQWSEVVGLLDRGRPLRHMHVYTQSVLHPFDVARVVQGYFEQRGFILERKITFLGHGGGLTNVYYVQPRSDMAHFELFLAYDEDAVITPADPSRTREGRNVEYWDDGYMEGYLGRFPFREPDEAERRAVRDYFRSEHWTQVYRFMLHEGTHSHVPVFTGIHPEALKRIGCEVMEERGWKVGKADAVVYSLKGHEQGKVTFLLSSPEIVVELDWEFDPDSVVRPRHPGLMLEMTDADLASTMQGLDYLRLDGDDIARVVAALGDRPGLPT